MKRFCDFEKKERKKDKLVYVESAKLWLQEVTAEYHNKKKQKRRKKVFHFSCLWLERFDVCLRNLRSSALTPEQTLPCQGKTREEMTSTAGGDEQINRLFSCAVKTQLSKHCWV